MSGPFHTAIRGNTTGAAATGAFTPNAATAGCRAWSTVPAGWIGQVRFEDGSAWELTFSYWNATTLSRSSTQLFDSSTGAAISLTSAATAAMVIDSNAINPNLSVPWAQWLAQLSSTTVNATGMNAAPTVTGTAATVALSTSSYMACQKRVAITSATTANAQSAWSQSAITHGIVSTSSGRGGFEYKARLGCSVLPTGPRLFVGMSSATFVGSTGEPSALSASFSAFTLDSTDTNIQFTTSNAGTATKQDTGIPLAANGWYEFTTWCEPGSNKMYGLLFRLDTGDIWFGSSVTNVPPTASLLSASAVAGLNGTNTGTAVVLQMGSIVVRGPK